MMTTATPERRFRGAIPPKPDARDFLFEPGRFRAPEPSALPSSVDLRCGAQTPTPSRPMGPVRDQGQEGSCVGHAVSEMVEALWMARRYTFTRLSPAFIYYEARSLEGTTNQDAGADPRDALDRALKVGICTEKQDPYVVGRYAKAPTRTQVKDALPYRIASYHACPDPISVKQALAVGCPVIMTIGASDSFENTGADGIVPQSSLDDTHDWDHENVIVGYDADWWLCQNSWGESWGQRGYYYVPIARFDYFYSPFTAALT